MATKIAEAERNKQVPPEWVYQALLRLTVAIDQFDDDLAAAVRHRKGFSETT